MFYDGSLAVRVIAVVLVGGVLINLLLKAFFGLSVAYINPFTLKIHGIGYRDALKIDSIRFLPLDKRVVVRGLTIRAVPASQKSSQPKSPWLKRYYSFMMRVVDGLKVSFFDVNVEPANITFATLEVTFKAPKVQNLFIANLIMVQFGWKGQILCEDASFTSKCEVISQDIGHKFPLRDLSLDLKVGDLTVPMDVLSRLQVEKGKKNMVQDALNLEDQIKIATDNLLSIIGQVRHSLHPVARLTASVDKITVDHVPMTTHPDLMELNQFLSLNLFAENLSFNAVRFEKHMPGFKLLFQDEDTPFKFNITMTGFCISMNMRGKCAKGGQQTLKMCEIPNVSIFGSTNLISQKFDYERISELQNAICTIKGHISSPTVDIDVDHLSLFKCFKKNIKVFSSTLVAPECSHESKSYSALVVRKKVLLNYFKSLLPLISVKLTLEDPRVVISDQDDFMMHKLSALMLDYNTERFMKEGAEKGSEAHYGVNCNIEMLAFKSQHVMRKKDYKGPILAIDNIGIKNQVDLVPEPVIAVKVNVDTFKVDLSELPTMIMMNNIIKKLDSRVLDVEENYFMSYYEKFAERLKNTEAECSKIGESLKCQQMLPSELMFRRLPDFLDYVKIDLRNVSFMLGARSVFMPPCVFSNIDSQSPEDLVDNKLRKYFHETDKIQIALFGNKTQWHSKIETGRTTMVQSGQSSDYDRLHDQALDDISTSDETEIEHQWNFNILINEMSSTIVCETPNAPNTLSTKAISKVSVMSIKVFPDVSSFEPQEERRIIVQIDNKRAKSVISIMNIFLVISGIHTLKLIFGRDVCSHNRESLAKKHFMAVSLTRRKRFYHYISWKELKSIVQFNFSSEVMSQIFVLPNGLTARVQTSSIFMTIKNFSDIAMNGSNFRLCVESPLFPNYWVRLITVLRFRILADIHQTIDQMKSDSDKFDSLPPAIVLENETWHFSIPHKFELYTLVDNIPTFYKSMKQIIHSFKTSKDDCVIYPHPVKTPSLPKINLKSKRVLFSIDDDPFEAEISMICQIGLEEQKSRLAKLEEFEKRTAADLLKRNKSRLSKTQTMAPYKACELMQAVHAIKRKFRLKRSASVTNLGDKRVNSEDAKPDDLNEDENLIPPEIEEAYHRLLENASTSWIRRIKEYKQKEKQTFENNFAFLWGDVNYSALPEGFNHKVLPFDTHPFLTNLIIEGVDIDVFRPSFGTEGVPNFIHDVGKGVPKSTQYSIMIPMYLDAKFKEIRWHLKDYPLPMVYIPRLGKSQTDNGKNIQIHGNLILAEDMIQSKKEIRRIFVPLVPSLTKEGDEYYSLMVPRTLTTPKIFTDLRFDINSNGTTQVTWGGGYQPAIQQTMQCLDNFSKPPIDPSPKIGFWDKMRYIFHARVKVSWKEKGKFEVCLKGGRSPHKIGQDAAGFIIGFSDDVVLNCNESDDPLNFLSCTAEKVHFSIPNHFAKPLLVWCQPSDQTVFIPSHSNTNLQQYASFYYMLDLEKSRRHASEAAAMRSHYIEKTGISLAGGIALNVGIVLERLKLGTKDRTISSRPHYDTRLCNPKAVEDKGSHDSYAGFRSDFIHMSFLLLSNGVNAYNKMQLSPAGLHTFMTWWRSFAGGLPVRRGPLFGLQSISPKFGEHLYTISYHADVAPLYITHIAHSIHSSHELKKNNGEAVEFAGLKAKTEHFVMDLHQRKEVMLKYQEGLDKTKKIMNLKFLEGDVSTAAIDIRAVEATFKSAKFVEEKEDSNIQIPDNDLAWYDPTDFEDTDFIDIDSYVPNLRMLRLLYSCQFKYRRRASYGDKFQVDPNTHKRIVPFKNNISHKCVFGEPLKLPFKALRERKERLIEYKDKLEQKLSGNDDESDVTFIKRHIKKTNTAIEKVELLLKDFETLKRKQDCENFEPSFNYPMINMVQNSVIAANEYENRYHVCEMLLKWNEGTRNAVFKYLHYLSLSRQLSSLSEQQCSKLIDEIIRRKNAPGDTDRNSIDSQNRDGSQFEAELNRSNEENFNEVLEKIFKEGISELGVDIDYEVHHNHIVHFISPQIQLITEQEPDSCVVVAAPSIMMKVMSFGNKEAQYSDEAFLKRYAVHFIKGNVFHFRKDEYHVDREGFHEVFFSLSGYGQEDETQWPPWLSLDLCYDPEPLASNAVVKELSAVSLYDNVSQRPTLYNLNQGKVRDTLSAYVPLIVVESNSERYITLYRLVTNLIMYMEPESAELRKQIEKLTIGLDTEDGAQLNQMLSKIQTNLKVLSAVEQEFLYRRHILDSADTQEFAAIRNEKADHWLRLYIMMRVFGSNQGWAANPDHCLLWNFHAKEIILHMLESDSTSFLDVAIAKLHFQREETSSGFNRNRATVDMAQTFDLQKGATYKSIFGPYLSTSLKRSQHRSQDQPLIDINWAMNSPVGGIKVIQYIETNLADLSMALEEETLKKIITWLFPTEFNANISDKDGGKETDEPDDTYDPELTEDYVNLAGEKSPDLHEMVQRSVDFFIMENLTINSFQLCISFRGKGAMRIANVTNFIFHFPQLTFENQTMRMIDLLMELKKVVFKDVLKHTAKFLETKVRNRPEEAREREVAPLRQLSHYNSYTKIEDMQDESSNMRRLS